MLQIVPQMRVLVARQPLDFRRGIDGTAEICRNSLGADPLSGAMFVFRNRSGSMVRILVYDGQGYWLATKRLSRGRFRYWLGSSEAAVSVVQAHELVALLAAGDWKKIGAPAAWRAVTPVESDDNRSK